MTGTQTYAMLARFVLLSGGDRGCDMSQTSAHQLTPLHRSALRFHAGEPADKAQRTKRVAELARLPGLPKNLLCCL